MPTKNFVITDHQATMIEKLVRSGRYQNASEVMRDALRLIDEREKAQVARLKALREAAQVGIDDMERGAFKEFASAREAVNYLRELSDEMLADAERK